MTDSEHDDDFEAYLKRRVPIDQRTNSPDSLEPPPELDRIIIGKARQAIQSRAPVTVFRAPKWALPVGLAATILVSFSIMLGLGMRAAKQKEAPKAPAVVEVAPVGGVPRAVMPLASPETPVPASAAESPASSFRSGTSASAASPSASAKAYARRPPPIKTAPWPPLTGVAARTTPRSDTGLVADEAADSSLRDGGRSRVAEHEMAANRLRMADATPGSFAPAPSSTTAPSAPMASAPAPSALAPSTLAPSTLARSAQAPAAAAAAASSPAASTEPEERRQHPDPRAWLDQIQKMRAAGLAGEAEQELKQFHDAYPTYSAPLPTPSADGEAQ
jgi:hypothetical protein